MAKKKRLAEKLGLKEYYVHMGLFDFEVAFVTGDYKQARKWVAWKYDDEEEDISDHDQAWEARGKCFMHKGYIPIVWVPRKPRTAREHATLAHECMHALFHLFEWAGLVISSDTEELFGHALAHLVNGFLVQAK